MFENEVQKVIVLNSFWGIFLSALSVLCTFIASVVALYLGSSYRRVIIVSTGHRIDKHTFDEKDKTRYQEISIYNASERKIRLQDYGYIVGNKKYTTEHNRVVYDLVRPEKKEIQMPFNGQKLTRTVETGATEHFPFYIFDGENCRFGLFPGDYSFDKIKTNRRLYVYVEINERIYRYYTGLTLKKFLLLTENIKNKSPLSNH